jgi:hypothetical protein
MNLLPSLVLALSPPAWLDDAGADHLSVMPAVHNCTGLALGMQWPTRQWLEGKWAL